LPALQLSTARPKLRHCCGGASSMAPLSSPKAPTPNTVRYLTAKFHANEQAFTYPTCSCDLPTCICMVSKLPCQVACTLYGYDCSLIAAVTGMTTVSCFVLQQLKAMNTGLQSVVMACASSGLSCAAYTYTPHAYLCRCACTMNSDYSMYLKSRICRLVMGQGYNVFNFSALSRHQCDQLE